MVTIEALRQAGMSEAEARRILKLYGAEPGEGAAEAGPGDKEAGKDAPPKPQGDAGMESKEPARAKPEASDGSESEPRAGSESEASAGPEPEAPTGSEPETPAQPEVEAPANPKPEDPADPEPESSTQPEAPPEAKNAELPSEKPAPDYAAENAALRARLIESELRAAGMAAGVPPERLRALARLADTSQVDVTNEDAARQIADAVAAALKEVPELASAPFAAGSLGTHPRDPARPTDPFARGLMGQ